jgi:hypothetical protein
MLAIDRPPIKQRAWYAPCIYGLGHHPASTGSGRLVVIKSTGAHLLQKLVSGTGLPRAKGNLLEFRRLPPGPWSMWPGVRLDAVADWGVD